MNKGERLTLSKSEEKNKRIESARRITAPLNRDIFSITEYVGKETCH